MTKSQMVKHIRKEILDIANSMEETVDNMAHHGSDPLWALINARADIEEAIKRLRRLAGG